MWFDMIIIFFEYFCVVTYCIRCMIVTGVYRGFCIVFIAIEGFNRLLYYWEQGVLAGASVVLFDTDLGDLF